MKYYKMLNENNQSCHGGKFDWTPYLPHDGQPGEWTPAVEGKIVPCKNGYHVTGAAHLLDWANAQLYEAEVDEPVEGTEKLACRRGRLTRKIDTWNDKILRLFACWCVRQVWPLLTDERSRNAVEVAERYANGAATDEELYAARDAARAAARDAGDAADAAAWAAGDAADAARAEQTAHLIEMLGLEGR